MEMDCLLLLQSIRSSSFKFYVDFIGKFLPWILAFDHVHFARCFSIHHYDMEMLNDANLKVFQVHIGLSQKQVLSNGLRSTS